MVELNHTQRWYTPVYLAIVFFIIGCFSTFIEALLPVLKNYFHINYTIMTLFDSIFFIAYALISYPIARVLAKINLVKSLQIGIMIIILGDIFWYGLTRWHVSTIILFLMATLLIAVGVVILFIVAEFMGLYLNRTPQANRLSLFQASHAIGALTAPWILTLMLFYFGRSAGVGSRIQDVSQYFLYFSIFLFLFVVVIPFSKLPREIKISVDYKDDSHLKFRSHIFILFWLSLFFYVGAEVTIASFIINHGISEYHISAYQASHFLIAFWIFIIIGRLIGGIVIKKDCVIPFLLVATLCALVLIMLAMNLHSTWGLFMLSLTGLCNSIILPVIYSLGLNCNNKPNVIMSGIMATAISGGAVMPLITGCLADSWGLRLSLISCVFCYGFILSVTLFVRKKVT